MIDEKDARRRAEEWITSVPIESDDEVVLSGKPTETEFGWVYFYNSKHFIETGDVGYALIGNAPIVVMKTTGEIRGTGTAQPLEVYLEEIRMSLTAD